MNNTSTRRNFLWQSGGGLGGIALAAMLQEQGLLAETGSIGAGGVLKQPHHPPKAKRVIQLFMAGAASHIDLFDHKPMLEKHHGEPSDSQIFQHPLQQELHEEFPP